MAWYVGNSSSVAKKVKKVYVGVNGVARKVKKLYVGVNGIARKVFGGEPSYIGTATPLGAARYDLAGTTIGDYALFGGGFSASSAGATRVDAYNKSLVLSLATDLTSARGALFAQSNSRYAIFCGGQNSNTYYKTAYAYDTSLTKTSASDLSNTKSDFAGTTISDYALFGGGYAGSSTLVRNSVNAYDSSLTKTNLTNLYQVRYNLSATSVGQYAIFAGGCSNSSIFKNTDMYNESLTHNYSSFLYLSVARFSLSSATVGNHALFAGGLTTSTIGTGSTSGISSVVDAYDESLTLSTITSLSVARWDMASATLGNYALFAGGRAVGGYKIDYLSSVVEAYDSSLTRTVFTPLSTARSNMASATLGDYALFAGGGYDFTVVTLKASDVVDVYTS